MSTSPVTTVDTAADAYRHAAELAAALAAKARYGFTQGPAWVRAEYVDHLAEDLASLADEARGCRCSGPSHQNACPQFVMPI